MGVRINVPKQELAEFCQRHRIHKLSFFGSVLRDDFAPESDVDVLVEFEPDGLVGYITLARIARELGEILGRPVDLNTPGMLSEHFPQDVIEQAEVQYVAA